CCKGDIGCGVCPCKRQERKYFGIAEQDGRYRECNSEKKQALEFASLDIVSACLRALADNAVAIVAYLFADVGKRHKRGVVLDKHLRISIVCRCRPDAFHP